MESEQEMSIFTAEVYFRGCGHLKIINYRAAARSPEWEEALARYKCKECTNPKIVEEGDR